MSERIISHIAEKYENIKKEVAKVMGGKVLEYEAKTILHQGMKQGEINTLVSLVIDGLLSIENAAAKLDMTVDEFKTLLKEQ